MNNERVSAQDLQTVLGEVLSSTPITDSMSLTDLMGLPPASAR